MYCPLCRVEYCDCFTQCSECQVSPSPGKPPLEPAVPPDPALGRVVLLETNDGIQLALAKGLLEDVGIPFFALGQQCFAAETGPQGVGED